MYPTGLSAEDGDNIRRADELFEKFNSESRAEYLTEAINLVERVYSRIAMNHPQTPQLENRLIGLLTVTNVPANVQRALDIADSRMSTLRPGTPVYAMMALQAAMTRFGRYMSAGNQADLPESMLLAEELVATAGLPAEVAAGARLLLAVILHARSFRTGDTADMRRAMATIDELEPDTPVSMIAGVGTVRDLQRMMAQTIEALEKPGATVAVPFRPSTGGDTLDATAAALTDLVESMNGGMYALDAAIERHRPLVQDRTRYDPDRSTLLALFGQALHNRFKHRMMSGAPDAEADLSEAIALLDEALSLPETAGRPQVEAVLGGCLLSRAQTHRARVDDLDEGIRRLRAAIEHPALGQRHAMVFQSSLAEGLILRSQRDLDPGDIDEAVAIYTILRDWYPEHSNGRAMMASRRAHALMHRADGDPHQVAEASRAAREAVDLQQVPTWTYDTAAAWGEWSWRQGLFADAGEAFARACAARYRLSGNQIGRADAELVLKRGVEHLVDRAAYALSRSGKPQQAVAVVETGRAVILSTTLDRDPARLDALAAAGREDLCRRYRDAVRAVTEQENLLS